MSNNFITLFTCAVKNKSMKLIYILFLVTSLVSCNYFNKQVPDEKKLLEQELNKIKWDEVDEFPSVVQCDSINDKVVKKQCLFDFITTTIQERIKSDTFTVEYPIIDTINVKITINPDATLEFETKYLNDSISLLTRKRIDSILILRLSDFPKVEPAIKRGIKVKSQMTIPIIIKQEK